VIPPCIFAVFCVSTKTKALNVHKLIILLIHKTVASSRNIYTGPFKISQTVTDNWKDNIKTRLRFCVVKPNVLALMLRYVYVLVSDLGFGLWVTRCSSQSLQGRDIGIHWNSPVLCLPSCRWNTCQARQEHMLRSCYAVSMSTELAVPHVTATLDNCAPF
jgi:hypothetical protein